MTTATPAIASAWSSGLPPGVYERLATAEPLPDVRLDVAAFVGLTERGPVATPVGIGSWSAFEEVFGRSGGGRLLPEAVRLMFANGGRRAVVVRAVGPAATAARWALDGVLTRTAATPAAIEAADPGAWGDRLSLRWSWARVPLALQPDATLALPASAAPPVGSCLRHTVVPAAPAPLQDRLLFVTAHTPLPGGRVRLVLDGAMLPVPPGGSRSVLEEVRGALRASFAERSESFSDLGLDPAHPRWVGTVLADSRLARVADAAVDRWVPADGALLAHGGWTEPRGASLAAAGADGAATTSRWVFFQPPAVADPRWSSRPAPLDALAEWDDATETEPVAMVALPDLLHLRTELQPVPGDELDPDLRFGVCAPSADPPTLPPDLDWPMLAESYLPEEVDELQTTLIEHCGPRRRIALLDVPPGRDAGRVLTWRHAHADDRAVAVAPYLRVPGAQRPLVVPPCGAVAGLVARTEARSGVHASPGNAEVLGAVGLHADPLLPEPGFLHEERIDVIRATERGIRLMGSRTTSLDPDWTHLNVRRVVDWLGRQLALDARWAVFEPNDRPLWRRLVRLVERRLSALGAAGAWAGSTPAASWFVRCDETTTTASDRDAGRVVVLVGVAPAAPAEFLVFELRLQTGGGDGG